MKKTKILTALGILLAMGVTACGGGNSSKSEQPPAPSSSQPGSSLNSDSSVNPGTSSVNQNSSSANKSSSSTQSSTPAPLEINAPAHNWGAAQLMDAKAEGQMMYNRFACQDNDGAIKVELEAVKGTFGGGAKGVKSGTPNGYMKLGSNNNTVTYKFYYNSAAKGTIYQRGMMDSWTSGNSVVTYECYTSSSQSSHRDEGNFDLKVNNKLVDWTAMKDVTCEEFFANGVDSGLGSSYSKMADCTIGAIELVPGENVIEYKRTGSFNFVIKDFVLIVKNEGTPIEDNVHTHQWSEFETTKEANCKETGSKQRTCVCGEKEVQEIPLAPHAFETYRNIPADEALGTINAKAIGCPDCNLGGIEWSAKDYDVELSKEVGASSDGQGVVMSIADKSDPNSQSAGGACVPETVGTRYVYKINSYEAKENVKLAFDVLPYNQWNQTVDIFKADPSDWKPGYIDMGEGADPRYVMAENRYGLVINGENAILGEDKLGKQSARDWYEFPVTFNLNEGLNTIEVVCLGGYPAQGIYGYRLLGLNPAEREHIHTLGDWQSDDTNHWKVCTGVDCFEDAGAHINEEAHTFGEWETVTPATCDTAGERQHTCTVCNKVVREPIAKLAHVYDSEAAASNAAGEGYIATKAYNCTSGCEKSALRWNALDFDVTNSKGNIEKNADNIRFESGKTENKNGAAAEGTHVVYFVKVSAAVEKASLAFRIKNTGGNNGNAYVFASITNDSSYGYYDNGDGTFTQAPVRYGVKINDVEYKLGEDPYGKDHASETGWFDWPVEFPLTEGINKIDVFPYGGYRANMYEFQLTGLPKVENTHTHTLGDWQSDDTNHWKECSGTDCPAGANAHINEAAHTFGDQYDVVPATCNSKGSYKVKCSVCNYVKTVETDMLEHAWGEAQTAISDATPHECASCKTMAYDLAVASPTKLKADLTWNITGLPAGNYEIRLYACASSTTLPQKYDSRYQFKVDEGEYIGASDDTATYASYGLGTGEKLENCQWSNAINTIEIGATAASFTLHWTNKGYSAFIAGVRLVKVA